jgi:hypothetical protein
MDAEETSVSRAARELSKLGAAKGGQARASALTAEQRQEIARRAAKARWAKAGSAMTAEEIVRALAAREAPVCDSNPSAPTCLLCRKAGKNTYFTKAGEVYHRVAPPTHKPDCPWRLAREWVAANGAP